MEIDDQMTKQTPIQIKHHTLSEHDILSEKIVSVQITLDRAIKDRDRRVAALDDLDTDFTSGSIEKSKMVHLLKIRLRLLTNAEKRVNEATTEIRALRADLLKVEDCNLMADW